jgi:two-component system cell cycle sensor histidine kinase/response regulator CckA
MSEHSERFRLFVIEDREDIALLIRHVLERASHEVVCCRTAADALFVLGQSSFDLVILDYLLEDLNGVELLQRLQQESIFVPVLMITAHGDEQLATRVLQAGALDYVVKDAALHFLQELPKRVAESIRRYRLEQMNRLLVQALESTRDGILITDRQGNIVNVNQALVRQTGYSREQLLGASPRLFQSGQHSPDFYARMWQTITHGQSWQGEIVNRRKDGTTYTESLTISPILGAHGHPTHFVAIYRDLTQHRQLEKQLLQAQKMQSIGTLAGGVAHEFNNLLAGINGYASLGLREPNLSPELRDFFRNIVDLSERAAGLTRQLLAFARKPALTRQPTLLSEVVANTVELVRRSMHQEVKFKPAAQPTQPLVVEADANQLQQALLNLGLNARDAILQRRQPLPPSEVAVEFLIEHEVLTQPRSGFPGPVPPGDYAVIRVTDRGIGMTTEVLSQALDPFFTTKEVGQGTGLGLSMVFGIVQGHQGYLLLESEPGRGTTAHLYLPRWQMPGPLPAGKPVAAPLSEPDLQISHTILVIDDEQAVLDVVRRVLEIAGHYVECHTSVQSYLSKDPSSANKPDLVILDLLMPREDPVSNFRKLRERLGDVPILLCTGQAEPIPALELQGQKISLLRKPFRMRELWQAVQSVLQMPPLSSSTSTLF